jgi:hypothetical protein
MKKILKNTADRKQAGYKHENPEHPNEFGNGIPPEKRGDSPEKPGPDKDDTQQPAEFIEPNPNWKGEGGKERGK